MSFTTQIQLWNNVKVGMLLMCTAIPAVAQDPNQEPRGDGAGATKSGYLIDVPVPMTATDADRLLGQLTQLNDAAPPAARLTVVMRYPSLVDDPEGQGGGETQFEDALKVARSITAPSLRSVRVISLIDTTVRGHSTLPILASDMILVTARGAIVNASAGDQSGDETVALAYRAIAAKRALFPAAVVDALVAPGVELALVVKVGGEQTFAAGADLQRLRQSGDVVNEEIWSAPGVPLRLEAKQLRQSRIAAGTPGSLDEAAELLDLAELRSVDDTIGGGDGKGVLLDISGAIVANRVRRWQSNLTSTLNSGDVNTWVVRIDSGGGSLDDSATLASWFAMPDPPLRMVAGLVQGEARGDAALVAVSCKPLYLSSEARLGGPGADSINQADLDRYDELIEQIATATKRPAALIRGLMNSKLVVYRYTHRKTGRVRFATEDDLTVGTDDADGERQKWIRGAQVNLAGGLSAAEAIELGLADGQSPSLEDTARRIGLTKTPEAVADRGLVRFVENLGRSQTLAFLLIFIGFTALSAEANAPGLGFPGFLALVCFALWFWIQFLAGTAEWLELVVFGLGILCIAMEVFVVPGFGVFGVGGLALTVLGMVLMSQTFVVPRNAYQMAILNRGVWVALGGAAGMIGGFVAMRLLLPHVPVLRGLVMEPHDEAVLEESEKLGDYSGLLGQVGAATTPLRPSGKARFGDQIVQVVSDGTMIAAGDPVRVSDVYATKVVVELVENG